MNLKEMKKKVLGLIEEINPNNENLTDDPDIANKINDVINQVIFEVARFKKIPKYVEMEVNEGDLIDFSALENALGYEVYQLNVVGGVEYELKASGTVIKVLESGTLEVDAFVYPERITEKTNGSYEFELSPDVLEVAVYGVAADLLKSDVSAEYGSVYATRFETMLQRLDPRYSMGSFYIDGGISL